jgi:hypothetical protein
MFPVQLLTWCYMCPPAGVEVFNKVTIDFEPCMHATIVCIALLASLASCVPSQLEHMEFQVLTVLA